MIVKAYNRPIYPLQLAFGYDSSQLIKLLIQYGADLKKVNPDQLLENAIFIAKSLENVKLAISFGAQIHEKHLEAITSTWFRSGGSTHPDNLKLIKIWQYLYQINPSIADFK